MARLAACVGGHVVAGTWGPRRWHHHNAADPKKASGADIGAMASGTGGRYAAMVHCRIAESRSILNRQLHAATGPHMAVFTGGSPRREMVRRRRNQRRNHGGHGERRRIVAAVALRAIGTARRGVGVDRRQRGHDREIRAGVARHTAGSWCSGYVVCGFEQIAGVKGIANVALRTFAAGGVGRIRHIELACRGLRAGLESAHAVHRILVHSQPYRVGLVARRASARGASMDHGCCRRWRHETSPGASRLRGPAGNHPHGHIRQVAVFAQERCWHVRGRSRPIRGRHDNDAGDAKKAAVGHIGPVATGATRGDAAVVEPGVCKARTVLNGQPHAAVGAHMAAFAPQRTHADVVGRRRDDGRHHTGCGQCRGIRSAVALGAIGASRRRVGVDRRNGRHHLEIGTGMAALARGLW